MTLEQVDKITANIDNARLEAVMKKWPKLRPIDSEMQGLKQADHGKGIEWVWEAACYDTYTPIAEQSAHALIFRSMVEQLPWTCTLTPTNENRDRWAVKIGDSYQDVHNTAFDALVVYWETQT